MACRYNREDHNIKESSAGADEGGKKTYVLSFSKLAEVIPALANRLLESQERDELMYPLNIITYNYFRVSQHII